MKQPVDTMHDMASGPSQVGLTPDQIDREASLRELGESMLAIEAATDRVRRAVHTLTSRDRSDRVVIDLLERTIRDLESTRRRMHQEGYLGPRQSQTAMFETDAPGEQVVQSLFPDESTVE